MKKEGEEKRRRGKREGRKKIEEEMERHTRSQRKRHVPKCPIYLVFLRPIR